MRCPFWKAIAISACRRLMRRYGSMSIRNRPAAVVWIRHTKTPGRPCAPTEPPQVMRNQSSTACSDCATDTCKEKPLDLRGGVICMRPSPSKNPAAYALSTSSASIDLAFHCMGGYGNFDRRIQVRMGRVSTRDTEEPGSRTTIGLRTMPTVTTRLAGIGRGDVDDPDTGQCRVVGDEGPELAEGPAVQHSPPAFPNRFPSARSNPFQVFKRNPTLGAFRRADNGLGQTLVHITRKSLLAPAPLPEQPLGALGSLLLELLLELLPKTATSRAPD